MKENALNFYIPLLDFIASALGEYFEVVLHDLSQPESTIIAIRNGQVTNRKVGDTLSDLTLSVIGMNNLTDQEFRKYQEEAFFRIGVNSENFVIRDEKGQPIGLFCINYNSRILKETKQFINSLFSCGFSSLESECDREDNKTTDEDSFMSLAKSMIDDVLNEYAIAPDRMVAEEKMQVVKKLNDKGVFQLKGIISTVAVKLNVSEATVYRYLNS